MGKKEKPTLDNLKKEADIDEHNLSIDDVCRKYKTDVDDVSWKLVFFFKKWSV